jgi:hypothetical protein
MVRFDRMQSSERIDIDEPNQKNSLDFTRTKSLTMTAPRNKKVRHLPSQLDLQIS